MNLSQSSKYALTVAGLLALMPSCSRARIEAINLANEGDQSVKVNVEGAISKYEQAVQLDPSNHLIIWKLAVAYEKKEDWEKMASTLSKAVAVAPDFANYWFKRGYALIKQAENGNPDAYEQAKEPLQKCVQHDPNYAECYHFLAEADLWTDDEQGALDNYTKAIEHDASTAYFYPPLSDLYINLKFYKEAETVAEQGTRVIPPTEKTAGQLYAMYLMLFRTAQARDDKAAMLSSMERAEQVAGESHPEISFNLGSTYAVMEPPQKEKAVRQLQSFIKRSCRTGNAAKFKAQCEEANSLIQKLGQ